MFCKHILIKKLKDIKTYMVNKVGEPQILEDHRSKTGESEAALWSRQRPRTKDLQLFWPFPSTKWLRSAAVCPPAWGCQKSSPEIILGIAHRLALESCPTGPFRYFFYSIFSAIPWLSFPCGSRVVDLRNLESLPGGKDLTLSIYSFAENSSLWRKHASLIPFTSWVKEFPAHLELRYSSCAAW